MGQETCLTQLKNMKESQNMPKSLFKELWIKTFKFLYFCFKRYIISSIFIQLLNDLLIEKER